MRNSLSPTKLAFACFVVAGTAPMQAGYRPDAGVDKTLMDRARAEGKTIHGFETADRICRGLSTLDAEGRLKGVQNEIIPRGPASLLQSARRRAQQALDRGASAREAARISGLHERTIWRMKADEDDGQGSLF